MGCSDIQKDQATDRVPAVINTFRHDSSSRRCTPVHSVEKLFRTLRHTYRWLDQVDWLWNLLRPFYDRFAAILYPNGVEWNINGTDRIALSPHLRAISGNHEAKLWTRIMAELKSGDVFADVGANVGLYTIAVAKRLGRSGRVIAFEPDPANFATLKKHIHLNGMADQVELSKIAVWETSGQVAFRIGMGAFSHVVTSLGDDVRMVECVCLDNIFSHKRLDIMKIDVEGYEEKVLIGGSNILQHYSHGPRAIFVETHPHLWADIKTSSDSLLNLLRTCSYEVFDLDGKVVEVIDQFGWIVARRS